MGVRFETGRASFHQVTSALVLWLHGASMVISETVRTEKETVTYRTGCRRFWKLTSWKGVLELNEIDTTSFQAGGTETSVAGVFSDVVVIITFVTVVTVIGFVEEGRVGGATIVVVVFQNQKKVVGALGGASKSNHVWWAECEYFDLIVG